MKLAYNKCQTPGSKLYKEFCPEMGVIHQEGYRICSNERRGAHLVAALIWVYTVYIKNYSMYTVLVLPSLHDITETVVVVPNRMTLQLRDKHILHFRLSSLWVYTVPEAQLEHKSQGCFFAAKSTRHIHGRIMHWIIFACSTLIRSKNLPGFLWCD